ncbi:hypothetical protein LIER_08543 [Lithospermum erythrorhizon]|uniref:Uncharacterized protein n=1 Tax=Lithospermum erythrorhizon TaxID=34254 RepID=A0AAV3PD62_LITER
MEHVPMERNHDADRLSQFATTGYETLPEATVVEWVKEEAFRTKDVMNNDAPEGGGSSVPYPEVEVMKGYNRRDVAGIKNFQQCYARSG